ncbi:MAG: LamG-like jellyroll fold domain-containing protein, partial [Polyangia bacterium]
MLQRLFAPALVCSIAFVIQACGSSDSTPSGSGGSTASGGTITPSGGTTAGAGGNPQVTGGSQKDAGMNADAAAGSVADAASDLGQACDQTLSDNWNTAACTSRTGTSTFSLATSAQVDSLVIWVDTSVAGVTLSYTLTGAAGAVSSGNLDQGTCDPYQSQWCALTAQVSKVLSAGSYSIQISAAAICANSGSSNVGFVRVLGCTATSTGGASGATGATGGAGGATGGTGGNGGASGGAGAGATTSGAVQPILHFTFDETSGIIAKDSAGNNDGTVTGGTWTAGGKIGGCLSLDGTGSVQVAMPKGLPVGSAPRTVAIWFQARKDLSASTEAGIVQWGSAVDGQMFGLITSMNAPDKLYFFGYNVDTYGTTALAQNVWYHGAVTYDGTNVVLYLNGKQEASLVAPLKTTLSTDGLTVGKSLTSTGWTGLLDDL